MALLLMKKKSTPGVAESKYIQVKPGETLTGVLLKQHICLKVQHNNTVIIQLNKNHKYYFQLYQQMFGTEYHWGVLIAQGTDGGLFFEKVKFGLLYLKKLNYFLTHSLSMNLVIQEFNLD